MSLLTDKLSQYTAPQEVKAAGVYPYFREICSEQSTEVNIDGRKVLMFGSNAYTGLTDHPKVKAAAIAMTERYGTGCAGSRFLNGTLDIHRELEQRLARFVGKEDCLVYSTGFFANLGTVSCVTGREDYIIYDERDHASIIEGRRLSYSQQFKFRHNDMQSLEKQLQRCEPDKVKLIVVDGVFSMEGDVCNLPEICALAQKYNASVMVDEAHGLGVMGDHGRGVCNHFGLTDQVDIIMGTFSKSLAAIGGFIATDAAIANYLRHNSRPFIFSASATPAAIGAAMASLDILETEPERLARLWQLTRFALDGFRQAGFEIGNTSTPIIPLFIRDFEKTFLVTKMAFEAGIFVNPVVPPAVPSGDTLIRISLMATHTEEQISYAIQQLENIFRKLEIIK